MSWNAPQPSAGSLAAVVKRACRVVECPNRLSIDCPEHARSEDLGVVASFDNNPMEKARDAQKR